jgi:predicted amidophosphoribosyltransferase
VAKSKFDKADTFCPECHQPGRAISPGKNRCYVCQKRSAKKLGKFPEIWENPEISEALRELHRLRVEHSRRHPVKEIDLYD